MRKEGHPTDRILWPPCFTISGSLISVLFHVTLDLFSAAINNVGNSKQFDLSEFGKNRG